MTRFRLALIALMTLTVSASATTLEHAVTLGAPKDNPNDRRPADLVMQVAFRADGEHLLLRRENGSVEMWNIAEQRRVRTTKTRDVFAYAPSLDRLLTRKSNDEVVLTTLSNERESVIAKGAFEFGAISADGARIALSTGGSEIEVWNEDGNRLEFLFTTGMPVRNGLAVSPDGRYVAAAEGVYENGVGHHTQIEVFDMMRGDSFVVDAPGGVKRIVGVWNVLFSPISNRLIADTQLDAKSGFYMWNGVNGEALVGQDEFESYWVRGMAISRDGATISTVDERANIALWDATTGDERARVSTGLVNQCAAFSPDGNALAVGVWDSTVRVYRLVEGPTLPEGDSTSTRSDADGDNTSGSKL